MRRPPVRRLVALFTFLTFGLVGILFRLAVLQVRDANAYQDLAREQRLRTLDLPAERGAILDDDRQQLALSLDARDIYADPRYVRDPDGTAAILAETLNLRERDLTAGLASKSSFVYVARQVDLETAKRVEEMGLPGIGFLDSTRRYYPNGDLASQVLGYVGVDNTGLAGLEFQYQNELAGTAGKRVVEIDPSGHLIPQGVNRDAPPVPGEDVVTTIDRQLQYRAEVALRQAVRDNRAVSGTMIVMDARTSEIYAMANYPWFDPNHFGDAEKDAVRNRAVTDVYEPGSVNKVVTAAAAIQNEVIPLDKRLLVSDTVQVSDHLFHDAHPHPPMEMTLADIISESSNVGTIRVAGMLGMDRMYRYLTKFGLGRATGVGFPGEEDGILPPKDDWYGTSMGTIPVGQGVAVTPLQMASVYAAIANGGVWVQPRLVKGFVEPDGSYRPAPPPVRHRVISRQTDETLTRILAYAVEEGTGQLAQIPDYWVAGKTGTALIPNPAGGYLFGKYVASFIGFLPASNPRLVIAAILNQPDTEYGGIASAPLFEQMARYAIARLRIPPASRPPLPPHAVPYHR